MRGAFPVVIALLAAASGCVPDSVAPDVGDDDAAGDAVSEREAGEGATGGGGGDGSAPEAATSADSGAEAGEAAAPAGPCDLTGRWLATRREVATAIGSVEASHAWLYYELAQSGTAVTVTKGLDCGENVRSLSAVGADVDFPKAWPAMMAKETDTGLKGSSARTTNGCHVAFAKHYNVGGATESFYSDPNQALPSASQQASGSTPGWEDWDGDGQPGYTLDVTGLVTGQIYIVTRSWSEWTGDVAGNASTFNLAVDWSSEQDVLGINGPSLLSMAASGVKDGDPTLHFVSFARLGATQATGTDAEICAAIRMLAPTLTPSATN
jgi:hypothetical protein